VSSSGHGAGIRRPDGSALPNEPTRD